MRSACPAGDFAAAAAGATAIAIAARRKPADTATMSQPGSTGTATTPALRASPNIRGEKGVIVDFWNRFLQQAQSLTASNRGRDGIAIEGVDLMEPARSAVRSPQRFGRTGLPCARAVSTGRMSGYRVSLHPGVDTAFTFLPPRQRPLTRMREAAAAAQSGAPSGRASAGRVPACKPHVFTTCSTALLAKCRAYDVSAGGAILILTS